MYLGVVLGQVTAQVSTPQAPWSVPWFVAPQGLSGRESGFKQLLTCRRIHGVFLGNQPEHWSKQPNGKVSLLLWILR